MTLALLDQWIAVAKEWQPLLAGLLAVIASVVLGAAVVHAAKIYSAGTSRPQKAPPADLRVSTARGSLDIINRDGVDNNLEKLRSLVRSALASLASVDADQEAARAMCTRIAAFQWQSFPIPVDADKRMQDTYGTFLNQFELLRRLLHQEWSSTEASSILIQMNANARALSQALKQMPFAGSVRPLSAQRE